MRFDDVFARVVGIEGGYGNDPLDPGGETKFGISKRAHPDVDIKNLTLEQAKEIYRRDYWDRIRADELPQPIDEFVFDYAVNSGVDHAARALQRAAGALPDGNIGPKTIALVRGRSAREVLRLVFADRGYSFGAVADRDLYKQDGHGWFARLFDKTVQALKEAT